jgi:hypothetical protein
MKAAKTIADMSAFPKLLPARSPRTEQNRRAKQAQRARQLAAGQVTVTVTLPAGEAQLLVWLRTAQSGSPEQFYARALVTGAKFVYNSGNVRGGKRRFKCGAAWPGKVAS